jgi:hypothetical protein
MKVEVRETDYELVEAYYKSRCPPLSSWSIPNLVKILVGINPSPRMIWITTAILLEAASQLQKRVDASPSVLSSYWAEVLIRRLTAAHPLRIWIESFEDAQFSVEDEEAFLLDAHEEVFLNSVPLAEIPGVEYIGGEQLRTHAGIFERGNIPWSEFLMQTILLDKVLLFDSARPEDCCFFQKKSRGVVSAHDFIHNHVSSLANWHKVGDVCGFESYLVEYPSRMWRSFIVLFSKEWCYWPLEAHFDSSLFLKKPIEPTPEILSILDEEVGSVRQRRYNYCVNIEQASFESAGDIAYMLQKEDESIPRVAESQQRFLLREKAMQKSMKLQKGLYEMTGKYVDMTTIMCCLKKVTIPDIVDLIVRILCRIDCAYRVRKEEYWPSPMRYSMVCSMDLSSLQTMPQNWVDVAVVGADERPFRYIVDVHSDLMFFVKAPDKGVLGWISTNIPQLPRAIVGGYRLLRIIGFNEERYPLSRIPDVSWNEYTVFVLVGIKLCVTSNQVPWERIVWWFTAMGEGFVFHRPFIFEKTRLCFECQSDFGKIMKSTDAFGEEHFWFHGKNGQRIEL